MYFAVIISVLVLVLVFWQSKKDDVFNVPKIDEPTENNPENGAEQPPLITYASSLNINLPATINILKGATATLTTGYVNVLPNDKLSELNIEIVPRYNSSPFGLEFSNSTLKANEVGSYNLVFTVPKSATSNFTETVTVYIYEDETNAHVSQLEQYIIKDEVINISDILNIKENSNYSIQTDSKITYNNGEITANYVGKTNLNVTTIEGYIKYNYTFEFTIKDQPLYSIVLNNVTNNTIVINLGTSAVFFINYTISNREEGDVSQAVTCEIGNKDITNVENISAPLIKIRANEVGSTILTIKSDLDNSVYIQINIIVKN